MKITKLKFGKRTVVVEGSKEVAAQDDKSRTYDKEFSETCFAPPTSEFKEAVDKLHEIVYVYLPIAKAKFASMVIGSVTLTQAEDGIGLTISVKARINNDLPWNFTTPYLSPELLDAGIQDTIDLIIEEALKYSLGNFGVQAELSLAGEEEGEKSEEDEGESQKEQKKAA